MEMRRAVLTGASALAEYGRRHHRRGVGEEPLGSSERHTVKAGRT